MKTYLDEVIEFYEAERATIEQLLAEYLYEYDYLAAHSQQTGKYLIDSKLYQLYKLRNPEYEEILLLENMEAQFAKIKEGQLPASLKARMSERVESFYLKHLKERIDEQRKKVEDIKSHNLSFYDSQEIDNALFSLVENKINGFKLFLSKNYRMYLNFKFNTQQNHIKIIIPHKVCYRFERNFYTSRKVFEKLNFSLEKYDYVYNYPAHHFRDAVEIKIMLSRLIYDLFQYNNKYDTAGLKYY